MRMPLLNHMFEYLVPVSETVLRGLRGVASLEECHWGWALSFQWPSHSQLGLSLCLELVYQDVSSQLLFQGHAWLPTAMLAL